MSIYDPNLIPTAIRESLDNYATKGLPPGGCVTAILCNDLIGAFGRADPMTTAAMPAIVAYVQNLPGGSYGSPERVSAWIAERTRLRLARVASPDEAALPRIFVFCNACEPQWHSMVALAEDGTCIAGHVCSDHAFAAHDMGIDEDGWKLDLYRKHYPDGFVVEWVEDTKTHPGWNAAASRNIEKVTGQPLKSVPLGDQEPAGG